jgi:hypothetical protein
VQFVLEATEGALARDGSCESAAGRLVADAFGEVGHVLVPDVGRQRMDRDQVQVVEINGRVTIDATVRRPQHDRTRLRVDQPTLLVVGLVRECGGDFLEVELAGEHVEP